MDPKAKAGPSGTSKKKKQKQRKPAVRFLLRVIKIFLIIFIAVSCAAVGIAGGALVGFIKSTPPLDESKLKIQIQNSSVYDSEEKKIAELNGSENKNRILASYDKIPKNLRNAFIAIEDERFESHNGIDIKRTLGAVISYITTRGNSAYGGSTITQQVVKNITGETDRSPQRKIQEQWRAIQLEQKLEKWQILELYMNLAYMGENYYGVESASRAYFGKSIGELSLAQCASLAGITNLPGKYNPFTENGKLNNKSRQKLVLQKMLENGFISQAEYDEAIDAPLDFQKRPEVADQTTSRQTYFVDQVVKDVASDLMAKYGYTEEIAYTMVYNYGLKIYTTQDTSVQTAMDEVFNNEEKYFPGAKNSKGELPQAGMAIVDPKTGKLVAVYGGRGEKTADRVLNRATQIKRQAGSSFKPLADYGPAIDQHLITAATAVDDVPVYMMGVEKGRYPENFPESYSGKSERVYRGLVSIRTAIARSINVVAAKTWMSMGPDISFKYLEKSGISMKGEDKYLSVSLGGLKGGVNPLDMAAAYSPFVNSGMYYQPITYTKVFDSSGNELLNKLKDKEIKQKSNVVYDEGTAFIMTDMMKDVCLPGGTASYVKISNSKKESFPVAGKTGTTNDDKDRWFVGYTPYYVGAVWYGYDYPTTVKVSGNNPSAVIWQAVMQKAHSNLQKSDFSPAPPNVIKKSVCIYSGKTPSELCSQDPRGNAVRQEYFLKGTEPKGSDVCDIHVSAEVCSDPESKDIHGRALLADRYCPSSVSKVFIKRKEPYTPVQSSDPYPKDWIYEVPVEYCTIHGEVSNDPTTGDQLPDDEGLLPPGGAEAGDPASQHTGTVQPPNIPEIDDVIIPPNDAEDNLAPID
ncbi:penicillin-binding protein 1A [Anaerobacterium chartisolvens]|uniref:Penicillin-binding protein 1A n=1 Tax=Anaerobacterium chartisolvens TaxID=1297424 RepID=A0A369BA75_9FIRM|nr:PBP1A family penicillin-binding protein [Anaerobacterium chartisolvens]RCX17466.1 penicillin-binding protein 1A [Anaerobacterium chartisolvens]